MAWDGIRKDNISVFRAAVPLESAGRPVVMVASHLRAAGEDFRLVVWCAKQGFLSTAFGVRAQITGGPR